jgi:hypothetical protein
MNRRSSSCYCFFSSFLNFRLNVVQHALLRTQFIDMHSQGRPVRCKDEDGYLRVGIQIGGILGTYSMPGRGNQFRCLLRPVARMATVFSVA